MKSKWQSFLDSISSHGGSLALLVLLFSVLLGTLIALTLKYGPDAAVTKVISDTFIGYSGALLLLIRSQGSEVPPPAVSSDSQGEKK